MKHQIAKYKTQYNPIKGYKSHQANLEYQAALYNVAEFLLLLRGLFIFKPSKEKIIKLTNKLSKWFVTKPIIKEKKIYRNQLCPCGSGLKYKSCCGKKAE